MALVEIRFIFLLYSSPYFEGSGRRVVEYRIFVLGEGEKNREDVEAVEEVFSEGVGCHAFFKVPTSGGNHADVDADGFVTADAFKCFFLKDA